MPLTVRWRARVEPTRATRMSGKFTITQEHAEVASQWWARQWIPDDTREAFRVAVRDILLEPDALTDCDWRGDYDWVHLSVDFDPFEFMLRAAQRVVPECSGSMFSAKGLLYGKTQLRIARDEIEASAGRRDPWVVIWRAAAQ